MASWAEQLQRELSGRGLAVASIPGKGRGLVASRSFFPREVIVCQEPYASTPNKISVGSSCDHCFAPGNLGKCSVCRVARYCGSACQKEEWKLHQLECQAIAALAEDRKKMLTPTIRMMVRLILRRKLQNEKAIPSSGTDNYNLVDALESHISEVDENQLVLYAQMANLVQLILPSFELDLKEITHTFSKFACNAHTICDPELRPLGTGLYPVISIINHSCVPNAVLVFEGRAAYVRALQPISKNTEVSVSYIETVAATMKRQNDSFSEKEVEVGMLQTEVREKTLVIHEISRIAKDKDQETKLWEERYTKSTTSHDNEVKKLDSRLAEQAVEIKKLREASTRNQEEMKTMKISLRDDISLLNNVLSGLRAEEVTPREDTTVAHTSTTREQVGTLQELMTTLKTNQANSIKEAVEGAVSYALAKLKARDPNLSLQPIETDFDCSEAEAERLIEEMQSVSKKVTEEMQIGSPSSK